MSPPRPQVPDKCGPGETSQIETAAPPESSTRFNFPRAKKAIDRPSGEKTSELASSVPEIGRASSPDSGRRKMRCPPCGSDATYASCNPSGETARKETSTKYEKVAFAGGGTEKRIVCGGCPRGRRAKDLLPRRRWRRQHPQSAMEEIESEGGGESPLAGQESPRLRRWHEAAGRRRGPPATVRPDPWREKFESDGRAPVGSSAAGRRRVAARKSESL